MPSDKITFIKQLRKNFVEVGALCPSSKYFSKKMVEMVAERTEPLNILEVGPGTGPITRQVLSTMGPEDHYTVCEINEEFIKRLERDLKRHPDFEKNKDRVRFFNAPIQEIRALDPEIKFDVIICCLPFNNFPPELVQSIMQLFEEIAAPGATLTLMEYAGIREFCSIFAPKEFKQRYRAVDKIMSFYEKRARAAGNFKRTLTLRNLPPAFAIHLHY